MTQFREMNKDKEVMEFFPSTLSDEQTDAFYKRIQDEIKDKGYGLYAAQTKEDGDFIGFIGFHEATFKSSFTPCVEIGWRLRRGAWGKGYATEGAKACLKYGFQTLGMTEVFSFTAKVNTRSQNVMKKIGLNKLTEFEHPAVDKGSTLLLHVLYGLKKEQWRKINE